MRQPHTSNSTRINRISIARRANRYFLQNREFQTRNSRPQDTVRNLVNDPRSVLILGTRCNMRTRTSPKRKAHCTETLIGENTRSKQPELPDTRVRFPYRVAISIRVHDRKRAGSNRTPHTARVNTQTTKLHLEEI